MRRIRDYLMDKVEGLSAECGLDVYQAAVWGDCGWWIFKDNEGNTKAKLYYDFDEDFCTVREDRYNRWSGVKFHYGNDDEERRLLDFIKGKIAWKESLEAVLGNAEERSGAARESKAVPCEKVR